MITDPLFYAAAIPGVLLIGFAKAGFAGVGMMSVPLIAMTVSPTFAIGVTLPVLMAMDAATVWTFRKGYSWENLRLLLPGGLMGVVLGTAFAGQVSEDAVRLALGLISAGFGVFMLTARFRETAPSAAAALNPAHGVAAGTASGFTTFLAHAGAPPVQLFLMPQNLDKRVYVGTFAVFFAVMNAVKAGPYVALGFLNWETLKTALVLIPLAPLGVFIGVEALKRAPQKTFYTICQWLMVAAGLKLIYDGATGIL